MQRYRADESKTQADGAIVWCSVWMGGRPLARINNCRLMGLEGNMRRTVYITGEPDTWFSIPAVTKIQGCRVTGYVSNDDDGNAVFFHHCANF